MLNKMTTTQPCRILLLNYWTYFIAILLYKATVRNLKQKEICFKTTDITSSVLVKNTVCLKGKMLKCFLKRCWSVKTCVMLEFCRTSAEMLTDNVHCCRCRRRGLNIKESLFLFEYFSPWYFSVTVCLIRQTCHLSFLAAAGPWLC